MPDPRQMTQSQQAEITRRMMEESKDPSMRRTGLEPMRMVKKNQNGTGKADGKLNAGLKALFAERPDLREKFGYGKKEATRGLKTYQDGTGRMERMEIPQSIAGPDGIETAESRQARDAAFAHNKEIDRLERLGQNQELGDGPFSQAVQDMDAKAQGALVPFAREFEQALADGDRWAEDMKEELQQKGFSMDDLKSGNVPAHTVAAVAGASGLGGREFKRALINHSGLKEKDVNYLAQNLTQYGRDIEGGDINVANMDKMMADLGYTTDDASFLGDAMAKGGIHHSQFTTRRMDDLSEGGGSFESNRQQIAFPTAVEFRSDSRKMMDKEGNFKGGYGKNNITFNTRRYNVAGQTDRPDEDFEGVDRPQPQQDPEPQPQPQQDPMDPMQGMTPAPRPVQTPKQVIEQRPDPVVEKRVIPGPQPEPDPDPQPLTPPDPKPTRPGPPPPMDLGIDTAMRSDYTGDADSSRATGPFANVQQQAGEGISAEELAEARRQMFQKMLGAKLNAMGRSYAKLNTMGSKYTMGTRNPRGMRMIRRQ